MLFRLSPELPELFPDPELAEPDGLLAVEGDLSPARLVAAYAQGIFPWFSEPPYLWWSPDPRCILLPGDLHVPRRLRRVIVSKKFDIRYDTAFAKVCAACASSPRPGQHGTWITDEMLAAYIRLHEHGVAHSVEAWRGEHSVPGESGENDVSDENAEKGWLGAEHVGGHGGQLAGGMYGVRLGRAFFGESMFYRESDASKAAFAHFALHFFEQGGRFIDCQQVTPHMLRFGARPIPRREFLDRLREALESEIF